MTERVYYMSREDYIESLAKNMYEYGYEERDDKIVIIDSNGLEIFEITDIDRKEVMERYNKKWEAFQK